MVGKTKAATVAERARMAAISESGCICCLLAAGKTGPAEVHHLTSAGRRKGHQHTIGACPYHHRGHLNGQSKQQMSGLLGPSHAWAGKALRNFSAVMNYCCRYRTGFYIDSMRIRGSIIKFQHW